MIENLRAKYALDLKKCSSWIVLLLVLLFTKLDDQTVLPNRWRLKHQYRNQCLSEENVMA